MRSSRIEGFPGWLHVVAVDSAVDVSPREGAARRQCLKRIKKRRLSERSEFRRFPFQVLATRAVSRSETAPVGVAFSWLLLLAKQEK